MFDISDTVTFKAPVKVANPGGEPQEFTAEFKLIGVAALGKVELTTEEGTAAFLREVLVSVEGVKAPKGASVVDALLDHPVARPRLVNAYFSAIAEAREKN